MSYRSQTLADKLCPLQSIRPLIRRHVEAFGEAATLRAVASVSPEVVPVRMNTAERIMLRVRLQHELDEREYDG